MAEETEVIEEYSCKCGAEFTASAFDDIDDELNESNPTCPPCQAKDSIKGRECEHCTEQAVTEADGNPLCEECYSEYADGFDRDD